MEMNTLTIESGDFDYTFVISTPDEFDGPSYGEVITLDEEL